MYTEHSSVTSYVLYIVGPAPVLVHLYFSIAPYSSVDTEINPIMPTILFLTFTSLWANLADETWMTFFLIICLCHSNYLQQRQFSCVKTCFSGKIR